MLAQVVKQCAAQRAAPGLSTLRTGRLASAGLLRPLAATLTLRLGQAAAAATRNHATAAKDSDAKRPHTSRGLATLSAAIVPPGSGAPTTPAGNELYHGYGQPGVLAPLAQEPEETPAVFRLASGETFAATSFGAPLTQPVAGEVVFTTSLVGYPESMTDPSYRGQILVFTQPLVGNYGVPGAARDASGLLAHFESERVQPQAVIVSDYARKYSHWRAVESLGAWCARHGVPALTGVDTRAVVHLLREGGSTSGCVAPVRSDDVVAAAVEADAAMAVAGDPNARCLTAEVCVTRPVRYRATPGSVAPGTKPLHVAVLDCGAKNNILRCVLDRGCDVTVLPSVAGSDWDAQVISGAIGQVDGLLLSNGPGDPRSNLHAVAALKRVMSVRPTLPIFGICMGHQLMGLAAGADVYKMTYGNRGHNQPVLCLDANGQSGLCYVTSQNHGFALDDASFTGGWMPWFRNANDQSNEGLRHRARPWRSVQFHPEAKGGPEDTDWLFEAFVADVRAYAASTVAPSKAATMAAAQKTAAAAQATMTPAAATATNA